MEIKNNNVTNVSPQAESQAQQSASKAKKKQGSPAEFDASLVASLLSQSQGASPAEVPVEAAAKVELSGKDANAAAGPAGQAELQKMLKVAGAMNQAHANATAKSVAAQAEAGGAQPLQFTDEKTLIKTQAAMNANGTMTDAFVAGPNQPWSPNWVFGAEERAKIAQKMEGAQGQSPLAGAMEELQRMVSEAQGGDAKQISQAGARLNQELGVSLEQLQGEIQSMELPKQEGQTQSLNRVGGESFLGLLQGIQEQGKGGDLGGGFGNGAGSQNPDGQAGTQFAQQQTKSLLGGNTAATFNPAAGSTASAGGLHVIEGGKAKPFAAKEEGALSSEMLGGGPVPFATQAGSEKILQPQSQALTGHVVPGSMMKDRLTNETIQNMTNSLSDIRAKGGNGEMRIRMNPGNLGELMIKVTTQGNNVGLKVQASDAQAKQILEESLNSLKDGLAAQNLSLARVDISVSQPGQGSASQFGDSQQQPAHQGAMNFDGKGAQFQENGGSNGSESRNGGDNGPVDLRAARARALSGMSTSGRASARDSSGRLNVIA